MKREKGTKHIKPAAGRIVAGSVALLILVMLLNSATAFAIGSEAPQFNDDGQEEVIEIDGQDCVDGEVIVKLKDADGTMSLLDSDATQELEGDLLVADVPEGESVESYIEELEQQPNVAYVQPNYIYTLEQTVNDPGAQLPDPDQWYLDTINVYEAWDTTMGSSDVKVAVLDTGIDIDHTEFSGQIYLQTDVVDDDGSADDDNGHGTHVCGIIAAAANNGTGIAGIAPGVQLIVVDVFTKTAEPAWFASTADIIEGIQYAVGNGADVINMSIGDYGDDTALSEAVGDAADAGVICVAAAGNDGITDNHYPSDYDACISVIWTNGDDTKDSRSNYGPQKDISAPGGGICSAYLDNGYAYMSGTSMATPVVSGVIALMLSVDPGLTAGEVKDILYGSVVDLGDAGRDDVYGWGRVDAQAAVLAAAGEAVPVISVRVDKETLDMCVGDSETLAAIVSTLNATDKAVFWTSDDESAATVEDGVVTAAGAGTAMVTATTGDGGFTDTCTVSVELADIQSAVYTINQTGGLIEDVTPGTTAAALKANILNDGAHIHIYDAAGTEYTGNNVSTGMTVRLVVGEAVRDELKIVVLGDCDGSGGISITDYTLVRLDILGLKSLNQPYLTAGDIDKNGVISITDYTLIRLDILGLKKIH
ncbi:MAG: S8 family serine peptidase [Eubacteriales bacterium]|nr:S8 family serine peptidase [Eubacteriales bacterium]